MGKRTVTAQFATYDGGRVAFRGQEVDFSEEDEARLDGLGAFDVNPETGTVGPPATDGIAGAFGEPAGVDPETGIARTTDNVNVGNPNVMPPENRVGIGPEIPGSEGSTAAAAPAAEPPPSPEELKANPGLATDLAGARLDAAVDQAGIDTSSGGSKADGTFSADQKRDALAAHYEQLAAEQPPGEPAPA